MTITAKVTSKGQITLPKKLRDELNLSAGDMVIFQRNDDGGYAIVHAPEKNGPTLESLFGMIKTDIRLTDEEIKEAIGDAASATSGRGRPQ